MLYFGTREALACGARYRELRAMYPGAHLLGCSTGGQIRNADVRDDEIAAVAMRFDATQIKLVGPHRRPTSAHSRAAAKSSAGA